MKNLDVLTIEDLRLIVAIIEEGSLTAGASQMRMSQSNASYAVKKIQNAFQSDLFLRKGRKLVASEFGWHVYHHTKSMLAEFQSAIDPPIFDAHSEFTLNFGATEYDTITVFPKVLGFLKKLAPKAKIRIVTIESRNINDQIEELDFIFAPVNLHSETVQTLKILDDTYVTIYDRTVRDAPLTLKCFANARHAIVSFDGSTLTNIDRLLAKKELKREVALSVFGFFALAGLMKNSDLITTLPTHVADGVFGNFATCKCPLEIEPMSLYLCWGAAKEQRGKIRWFVELMSKAN